MAWLDDNSRGRKRRVMAGGLGSSSPWQDMIDVIMEAHPQALRTSAGVHDRHGPRDRSAINGKAKTNSTTCVRLR